jgi:hypothetical protein
MIFEQLVLGQLAAQQDLVADGKDVRVPGLGDLDGVGQFRLVLFAVLIEPDADHGLQPVLRRSAA